MNLNLNSNAFAGRERAVRVVHSFGQEALPVHGDGLEVLFLDGLLGALPDGVLEPVVRLPSL